MSSFALYFSGFLIFVMGLSLAAHMVGVPLQYIGVGALTLIGLGMFMGVGKTRQKDTDVS